MKWSEEDELNLAPMDISLSYYFSTSCPGLETIGDSGPLGIKNILMNYNKIKGIKETVNPIIICPNPVIYCQNPGLSYPHNLLSLFLVSFLNAPEEIHINHAD